MNVVGYEFREGFIPQKGAKVGPDLVGRHLELLRQQFKGELTPPDVLADARNPNSPLHGFFEWDDNEAAEQYRLSQARGLIRSVVAIYREPKASSEPVRIAAFTHIAEGEASHYRATHHAMSQKATRDVVLAQAWRELQQWRRKYQHLRKFADLFEAIDEIGEKLKIKSH